MKSAFRSITFRETISKELGVLGIGIMSRKAGVTRRQSQRASLDTVRDDGFKTGDVDSQSTSPSDSLD
jgi:hypothetical protein